MKLLNEEFKFSRAQFFLLEVKNGRSIVNRIGTKNRPTNLWTSRPTLY